MLPQEAFDELVPFPNRSNLTSRHNHHLAKVKQQWVAREKERKASTKKEAETKVLENNIHSSTIHQYILFGIILSL